MGLPMVIALSLWVIREVVDQTVVSVGPYIFQTDALLFNNSRAKSWGIASPPHRTFRLLSPCHPASNRSRHVAGVACITVVPDVSSVFLNSDPSLATSRVA